MLFTSRPGSNVDGFPPSFLIHGSSFEVHIRTCPKRRINVFFSHPGDLDQLLISCWWCFFCWWLPPFKPQHSLTWAATQKSDEFVLFPGKNTWFAAYDCDPLWKPLVPPFSARVLRDFASGFMAESWSEDGEGASAWEHLRTVRIGSWLSSFTHRR